MSTLPLRASFAHTKAGHCGSGALRDLLAFHRLDYGAGPLSEGAVFGLAGGLGFLYLQLPQMRPPVYLVGRTGTMEEDAAGHLGLGLDVRETDDAAQGWAWVREQIDAGRPPMVWADIKRLEYLRVRMHNTRHDIVVVDYDEDAGVAWIADNDREELQPCSLASLAQARSSTAFPGPNRHRIFVYDWPAILRDPREATRAAIARAVRNMTEGGEALANLTGANGLDGVAAFAADYPTWPDAFGEALDDALKGLWVFVVKAGTGGAMFRSLHATFLHELAGLLEDERLERIGSLYDELTAAWIALSVTAGERDHAGGLVHVETVARLEVAGVDAMREWLAAGSAETRN
ncbi:MAG: hypothetical protein JWO02_2595 [Solirubrobacterales bacterium]|nr:hypothetical protein [Solirubrobacterales bacterium]